MVNDVVPIRYHEDVRRMYNWGSVAERTEKVRSLTNQTQRRGFVCPPLLTNDVHAAA